MADTAETVKTAADSVKKTVEQNTATAKVQGEKVQAAGAKVLREGLDKTTASLSQLSDQSKENMEAIAASAAAAQKGAEALSKQALDFSKTSWEQGVAAAQTMSQARSVQELIELQTNYTKSAMETYMSEVSKMTEIMTASVKDSFKPINERMTASVEKFQAAR